MQSHPVTVLIQHLQSLDWAFLAGCQEVYVTNYPQAHAILSMNATSAVHVNRLTFMIKATSFISPMLLHYLAVQRARAHIRVYVQLVSR